jgi:hypothetical protein
MSNDVKEIKKGFIDVYHGKAYNAGSAKAPIFEGQIKIDGKVTRFKLWSELKEGITNNERFSGYLYELERVE